MRCHTFDTCHGVYSMFENAEYYNEERARKLIRALFAWVVLEAQDKKCWHRVMHTSVDPASLDKGTQQETAVCAHSTCVQQASTAADVPSMEALESALSDMSLGKLRVNERVLPCLPACPWPCHAQIAATVELLMLCGPQSVILTCKLQHSMHGIRGNA